MKKTHNHIVTKEQICMKLNYMADILYWLNVDLVELVSDIIKSEKQKVKQQVKGARMDKLIKKVEKDVNKNDKSKAKKDIKVLKKADKKMDVKVAKCGATMKKK